MTAAIKTYCTGDVHHTVELSQENGYWYVRETHNGKRVSRYVFDTERQARSDFQELCHFFVKMTHPMQECASCNPSLR